MSEGDSSKPAIDPEVLLSVARELTDAAAEMRAIRSNSSVIINAGGITNAIAVCVAASTVMLFILFAIWVMWQVAEVKGQQEAWIQVWQQRVAEQKKD